MIQIYSEVQPWFISFPSCIKKMEHPIYCPKISSSFFRLAKAALLRSKMRTFNTSSCNHTLGSESQESPKSSTLVLTEGVFEKPLFYVYTQLVINKKKIYIYIHFVLSPKKGWNAAKDHKKPCEITSWFASLLGGYFNSIEICQIGSLSLSLRLKIMRHNVWIVEYNIITLHIGHTWTAPSGIYVLFPTPWTDAGPSPYSWDLCENPRTSHRLISWHRLATDIMEIIPTFTMSFQHEVHVYEYKWWIFKIELLCLLWVWICNTFEEIHCNEACETILFYCRMANKSSRCLQCLSVTLSRVHST